MLAVEVDFLTGRFVAARHDDRDAPEWPPHPARLFSALVAEWGATPEPAATEAALLRRLESVNPPLIATGGVQPRVTVTHYVPVNDTSVVGVALWSRVSKAEEAHTTLAEKDLTLRERGRVLSNLAKAKDVSALASGQPSGDKAELLPEHRPKQARTFPSLTLAPDSDGRCIVTYQWPELEFSDAELEALDALLARVTRLGHSSSMVSCRTIAGTLPEPTYRPDRAGHVPLRTVTRGQWAALVDEHARHRGSAPRSLPATVTPYATESTVTDVPVASTAGAWFAYEVQPRMSGRALANLTGSVRSAVEESADPADTEAAHEAFVLGLPNVGHAHASGDLLGVAVLLPRTLDPLQRQSVLRAVGLGLGDARTVTVGGGTVEILRRSFPELRSLTRERWTGPAREWVTATPLVIAGSPRHKLAPAEFEEWTAAWITESCLKAGLPAPDAVSTSTDPLVAGARPVRSYPQVIQDGRVRRLVHARLRFEQAIVGPILLGGGRHRGFGLLTPWEVSHA